mmetsp:Transcript_12479/g.34396  ORF Transcript_12479/g.34396 Transcript_12479/m.34396 type:complete len:326 (-) Transcript_12479:506-1483(-)
MSGSSVHARLNQDLALSTLRSDAKSAAMDAMIRGSLSHRFNASTDFAFRCGRGAALTACAQSAPLPGHSCRPFASNASAALMASGSTPDGSAASSWRTAASHSHSFLGTRVRACSKIALDLAGTPHCCSNVAAAVHSGTHAWHRRHPFVYAVRAASTAPCDSSSCPSMSHIFHAVGNLSSPSANSRRSSATSPTSRSTIALFIQTRSLTFSFSRTFASSIRARSGSLFSNSSLNAASQISSLSGFTTKASSRTSRAPGTSPHSQRSFAAINHKISARGQCTTARLSMASIAALSFTDFSSLAASTHRPFLAGNSPHACDRTARAV